MKIIYKKLSELKPYDRNPRINDGAVPAVAASIQEYGFKVPIVIDKDGTIIAGHTRFKAAKKLKMNEVPCLVADDLTPEQVKQFRLVDNRVGEISNWDFALLDQELAEIDIDMSDFGFEENDQKEKEQKDLSEEIKTRFKVEVECLSENDQEILYNELIERGFECRLLTL